jgi:hypothetical protein
MSIDGCAFYGCTGLISITIPNSVTSIDYEVFRGCTGLTSITIPDSVTSIGSGAFEDCTGLTSIIIPDSVTSMGGGAFEGCTGLTSITIGNSVTSIGDWAFWDCTGLTGITIPNSVTSIGNFVFEGCTGLTSVTIGNSVTSIGRYEFSGCTGLTSVTIGNSVTSIGDYAFGGCTGLTSITIPDSVTSIGMYAFVGCKCLTSVTIGNSVTSIGYCAFDNCTSLKDVYYSGTQEQWNGIYGSNGEFSRATIHFNSSAPAKSAVMNLNDTRALTRTMSAGEQANTVICDSAVSGNIYMIYAIKNYTAGCAITTENLCYVGQSVAAADGKVTFEYNPKDYDGTLTTIVVGDFGSGVETVNVNPITNTKYTVTWNVDSDVITQTYLQGDTITAPTNPTKDGYIFKGWSPAVPTTMPAQNLEFTAVFEKIPDIVKKVSAVSLDDVNMNYKDSTKLTPNITADEGAKYTVTWTSSDNKIARVDENGNVYAAKKGTATITCTVTDSNGNVVTDTSKVTVKYTFVQILIRIFLLGFLWY